MQNLQLPFFFLDKQHWRIKWAVSRFGHWALQHLKNLPVYFSLLKVWTLVWFKIYRSSLFGGRESGSWNTPLYCSIIDCSVAWSGSLLSLQVPCFLFIMHLTEYAMLLVPVHSFCTNLDNLLCDGCFSPPSSESPCSTIFFPSFIKATCSFSKSSIVGLCFLIQSAPNTIPWCSKSRI